MKLTAIQKMEVELAVHERIKLLKARIESNPNGAPLYERQIATCQEALAELQKDQP